MAASGWLRTQVNERLKESLCSELDDSTGQRAVLLPCPCGRDHRYCVTGVTRSYDQNGLSYTLLLQESAIDDAGVDL